MDHATQALEVKQSYSTCEVDTNTKTKQGSSKSKQYSRQAILK
jgi:hypothetical protein